MGLRSALAATGRHPDGLERDNDRIEIGPTALAYAEWELAGLKLPDLGRMRAFRLQRLVQGLQQRQLAAVLLFDPLNIRYATDSSNMQLWNTHNPFRACLVCADGYMVLWDYKNAPFLAAHNPLVREVRSGASMFYFAVGDRKAEAAQAFAAQVLDVVRQRMGPSESQRLGVDKIMPAGWQALQDLGLQLHDGEALCEHARAIKCSDEVRAMRCAIHACEQAMHAMRAAARPGLSEAEIWAVLHAGNIARGGEWIETRLLTSGPRTNPWFQECGPRVVQPNEVLGLDTDLVGVYGMCCDISRTWWLGPDTPPAAVRADYALAREHIAHNLDLVRPGLSINDWVERSHRLPPEYQRQKYSCLAHGVGLCDEWPLVAYPDEHDPLAFDYVLQPGMALCVEALVSREGASHSVKLEEQIVVTDTGFENLTRFPWDTALMA